jgi:ATP-binding cassette subfamily F protein 3
MEITEAPRVAHTDLKFRFTFDVTPYNEILTAKNISVTLGGKKLIDSLDLQVKRGERLVIAGPNGAVTPTTPTGRPPSGPFSKTRRRSSSSA